MPALVASPPGMMTSFLSGLMMALSTGLEVRAKAPGSGLRADASQVAHVDALLTKARLAMDDRGKAGDERPGIAEAAIDEMGLKGSPRPVVQCNLIGAPANRLAAARGEIHVSVIAPDWSSTLAVAPCDRSPPDTWHRFLPSSASPDRPAAPVAASGRLEFDMTGRAEVRVICPRERLRKPDCGGGARLKYMPCWCRISRTGSIRSN